jgi:hypothetical protein
MTHVSRLSVAMHEVDRGPIGFRVASSDGRAGGLRFDVTVTPTEMHIAFADRAGPSFVVSLQDLGNAMATEIDDLVTGKRGRVL